MARKTTKIINNMSDCLNHKKEVAGISDMKVLAEMIENLHYKSMSELFDHLSNCFWVRYHMDNKDGKHKLSIKSAIIRNLMNASALVAKEAWQISKPFMEEKQTKL